SSRLLRARPLCRRRVPRRLSREPAAKAGQWPSLPPDWHYKNEESLTPVPNKVTFEEFEAALRRRLCSAERLSTESYEREVMLTTTQEKLRDAYRHRIFVGDRYVPIAFWTVIVLATPWLWYFVLDRLRELSAAIQGKKE